MKPTVLHCDRQTVRTWQFGADQQPAVQPVGNDVRRRLDTDRCTAGSASAPRTYCLGQRTELSAEGQSEIGSGGVERNGFAATINRLQTPPGWVSYFGRVGQFSTGVDRWPQRRWPDARGISGRIKLEWVAECRGIRNLTYKFAGTPLLDFQGQPERLAGKALWCPQFIPKVWPCERPFFLSSSRKSG